MYLSSHFNLTVTLGSVICSYFTDSKAEPQRGGVASMPQGASGGAVCVTLQRSELPYCTWSTRCGECVLHCWDFRPPHGALVTVFFRDTGAHVKGLFSKGDSDVHVQERWCEGCVTRSLQFLEITTLGELACISPTPPAIHCVLIFVGFSPFGIPPTLLHDVYVAQFLWGYVFFYSPPQKRNHKSQSHNWKSTAYRMLAQVQVHQGLEQLAVQISVSQLEFSINIAFC